MTKQENKARTKGIMYVQQLDKLPLADVKALTRRCRKLKNIKRFALIVHNKDINQQGELIPPHVHVMLEFAKSRSIAAVAKELGDKPQFLENMTKRNRKSGVRNGFAYLIHRTRDAKNKYQYDPRQVVASFDYVKYLQRIQGDVLQTILKGENAVRFLVENVAAGRLTRDKSEDLALTYNPTICSILTTRLDALEVMQEKQAARRWVKKMEEQHRPKMVIWLCGAAGTGKSVLARALAQTVADKTGFAINGSSRDYFQDYHGEHVLIIDDFRPETLPYEDLLRITDPYSYQIELPARYHDRQLLADKIIITSPFNPLKFYQSDFQISHDVDDFDQLHRRLTVVVRFEPDQLQVLNFQRASPQWKTNVVRQNINPIESTQLALHYEDCVVTGLKVFQGLLSNDDPRQKQLGVEINGGVKKHCRSAKQNSVKRKNKSFTPSLSHNVQAKERGVNDVTNND